MVNDLVDCRFTNQVLLDADGKNYFSTLLKKKIA